MNLLYLPTLNQLHFNILLVIGHFPAAECSLRVQEILLATQEAGRAPAASCHPLAPDSWHLLAPGNPQDSPHGGTNCYPPKVCKYGSIPKNNEPIAHLLLASQPRSLLVSSLLLCEIVASFASTLSNHLETNS